MTDELQFSRSVATAKALGVPDADAHRFVEKAVLLTGAASAIASPNGAEIMRDALLLLVRMCTDLTVVLPEGFDDLEKELTALGVAHAWDAPPRVMVGPISYGRYDAVLSVGGQPRVDLPWTVVAANGWTARATSTGTPIDEDCGQENPITALAAASLGVSEVFKRLLNLRSDKGKMLDGCSFSLWTYAADDADLGPVLPDPLDVDLLVAGCGAIGNGVAHLLSRLPVRGQATMLDRQEYGPENWGTSVCLTRRSAERRESKASFLASVVGQRLATRSVTARIEDFTGAVPTVVLNGFDEVDARHGAQALWADLTIDGAIGPRLECQVSCCPWESAIACLKCVFMLPAGEAASVVGSRTTGLSEATLKTAEQAQGDVLLTEEHLVDANPEKVAWLRARLGKPVCSILEEATAIAGEAVRAGFRPSVPFVATMSACLMMTELVRYVTTGRVRPEPRFQFHLLIGPAVGEFYDEERGANCECVRRARNINKVRAARSREAV